MKLNKFELLLQEDAEFDVILIDIGLGKSLDSVTPTQDWGNLMFWSPDVYNYNLNEKTDVYSLGAIMMHMLVPIKEA